MRTYREGPSSKARCNLDFCLSKIVHLRLKLRRTNFSDKAEEVDTLLGIFILKRLRLKGSCVSIFARDCKLGKLPQTSDNLSDNKLILKAHRINEGSEQDVPRTHRICIRFRII